MKIKQFVFNLIIIIISVSFISIGVMNRLINSYLNDSHTFNNWYKNVINPSRSKAVKTPTKKFKKNTLIPTDPAEYNIQVIKDIDLHLTQGVGNEKVWDVQVKNALAQSKIKRSKISPKELKERLGRVIREIKELERKKRQGFIDQSEEVKLQSLYILKSSLTALGE